MHEKCDCTLGDMYIAQLGTPCFIRMS